MASQVATLDQPSDGRATLAVGLGAVWSGDTGKHYRLELDVREDLALMARPVQERIPIWEGETPGPPR